MVGNLVNVTWASIWKSWPRGVRKSAEHHYLRPDPNPAPATGLAASLHCKSIGKPDYSVRIGDNYRDIGRFIGNEFVWEWIGSHADYDKRF